MIGRGDVTAAAERIAGRVRRTPTLRLDDETVLKLEHLQHTGSFKARGACVCPCCVRLCRQAAAPGPGVVAAAE